MSLQSNADLSLQNEHFSVSPVFWPPVPIRNFVFISNNNNTTINLKQFVYSFEMLYDTLKILKLIYIFQFVLGNFLGLNSPLCYNSWLGYVCKFKEIWRFVIT